MSQLPFAAHGDTLPVVKITTKYEGSGAARHGKAFEGLLKRYFCNFNDFRPFRGVWDKLTHPVFYPGGCAI